jgi:hypothetical protein
MTTRSLDYGSDEFHLETDIESDDEPPQKRRRGPNRDWIEVRQFSSAVEAEEELKSRNMWKKCDVNKCEEGVKVRYRCLYGRYRVAECPAAVYLLFHSHTQKVTMFETECGHSHTSSAEPTRGLSLDMKKFIAEKYSDGIRKPKALLALMRRKKMSEPAKNKLEHYLKVLRRQKYGEATVSAHEIDEWCEARKQEPSDVDEPFVLRHEVSAESTNTDEQKLRIVITTRRLLGLLRSSSMLATDATYKLTWNGFPIMLLGTTDKGRKFHPFGVIVSKGENTDDFRYFFEAFHMFDRDWHPTELLADASVAITNAFISVFGQPLVRIMCYFHVLHNVEKYLKVLPIEVRAEIKRDIDALQTCDSETKFTKAADLFLCKWRLKKNPKINDFLSYFQAEWVEQNNCWYEGAAPGLPSTNNGIEATNSHIKRENTLRERLPVSQFLSVLFDIVEDWSRSRNPECINCIPFATTAPIDLKTWTLANQWALMKKAFIEEPHSSGTTTYYVAAGNRKTITAASLKKFKSRNCKWKNFEEFCTSNYGTWVISVPKSGENTSCSCRHFQKKGVCKHALGMLIRLQKIDVPNHAKSVPFGQKRKRGRPSKARPALIIQ